MDVREFRKTAVEVFIGMLIFTVFVFVYRYFNPNAFIGLEYKVLWVLTLLGIIMFLLYVPYKDVVGAAPKPGKLVKTQAVKKTTKTLLGATFLSKKIKVLVLGVLGAAVFFIITNSFLLSVLAGIIISSAIFTGFDKKIVSKTIIKEAGWIRVLFTLLLLAVLSIMVFDELKFILVADYFDIGYLTAAGLFLGVILVFVGSVGGKQKATKVKTTLPWVYHISTVVVSVLVTMVVAHILTDTEIVVSTAIVISIPSLALISKLLLGEVT